MQRRSLVTTIACVSAGLAGCTEANFGGGDGLGAGAATNYDPETVIRNYYTALNDGDAETANSYLHPEAETAEVTEDTVAQAENVELEVTEITTIEESDDEVVVEAMVQTTTAVGANTVAYDITLRRYDSEWKIYADE